MSPHVLVKATIGLLLGALVYLLVLMSYVGIAGLTGDDRPLDATLQSELVKVGNGRMDGALLVVTTDNRGGAGLKLPWNRVSAGHYALLHLRFAEVPENARVTLAWSTDADTRDGKPLRTGEIDSLDYWLYLPGNPRWSGVVDDLKLVLRGKPGERFMIESISLQPLSMIGLARSVSVAWPLQDNWTQRSVNFHNVIPAGRGPLRPAPAVALFVLCALLAYGVWNRSKRKRFDLHVTAAIVVTGWLFLDLLWMGRLVHQADATHQQFAGRSTEERLSHGPDAALYRFVSEVKNRLNTDEPELRLFVASSSDYKGMRTAYYLYPNNVYWRRKRSEMLDARYLRSGDHIILVSPTTLEIDRRRSALILPGSNAVEVEPVLVGEAGMLLKVP